MSLKANDLSRLSDHQIATLRSASRDYVIEAVRSKLEHWLNRPYVDSDDLLYSGVAVGRSGHDGLDRTVAWWVDKDPVERRWDIAALFLWGYWRFAKDIDATVLRRLMVQLKTLSVPSDAYASILLALGSAFPERRPSMSDELFLEGRRSLFDSLHMLRQKGLHKGVVDALTDLESQGLTDPHVHP